MIIKEHDVTTGEIIEREMNAEELAQWESDKAEALAVQEAEAAKSLQRQVLLDKLGITAEEAQLLIGGSN